MQTGWLLKEVTATFVPRKDTRGRRVANIIPLSLTVTATFRNVPPFPHVGQKILPISVVTLEQAWHLSTHLMKEREYQVDIHLINIKIIHLFQNVLFGIIYSLIP